MGDSRERQSSSLTNLLIAWDAGCDTSYGKERNRLDVTDRCQITSYVWMTGEKEIGVEFAACVSKQELHNRYQMATASYSRAVEVLNERIDGLSRHEYDFLRQFVDDARARSEEARDALDRHVAEHGC
jgi:hypothetical protein